MTRGGAAGPIGAKTAKKTGKKRKTAKIWIGPWTLGGRGGYQKPGKSIENRL